MKPAGMSRSVVGPLFQLKGCSLVLAGAKPRAGVHLPFFVGGRSPSGHRARLAPKERACGARQGAGSMPAACPSLSLSKPIVSRKAWGRPVRGCVFDGEERRAGVGARTRALRQLARRNCLSAVSAANEASSAARPQREYRSAPRVAGRRIRSLAPVGPKPCVRTASNTAHLRKVTNAPTGPVGDGCFLRRGSRQARWSN